MLDVARILADKPAGVVLDDLDSSLVGATGIGFADPVNPLTGMDLHVDPVAASDVAGTSLLSSCATAKEGLAVCDLHGGLVPDLSGNLKWHDDSGSSQPAATKK